MSDTTSPSRAINEKELTPLVKNYLEGIENFRVPLGFNDGDIEIVREKNALSQPFLTVIMRTQGGRLLSMEQALTCLLAQDNHDFEVIICIHNPAKNEQANSDVESLVDIFPASLRDRISIVSVAGGRRGVPMNVGISRGVGRYVAFLDDDDLVTGSWVSCFAESHQQNEHMIVRNRCVDRVIQKRSDSDFTPILTESNWLVSRANDFYFLESLERNSAPLHSYAIPREAILQHGTFVDPELDVAEDWDYLMRNAAITGVANHPETTAIYNRWSNSESSLHLHDEDEWKKSHKDVIARLTTGPVMITAEEASVTHDIYSVTHQMRELVELISDSGGFGALLERLSKLERFEQYAASQKSVKMGSSSQTLKERLPAPLLRVLVYCKKKLRSIAHTFSSSRKQ